MRTYGPLVLMVLAGLAGRSRGQGEQCVVRMQAPEGSPWRSREMEPRRVPLRKVISLVEKYDLKLEEGPPPPLATEAHLGVACEHLGDMRVALPFPHEDESLISCWFERVMEKVYILVGQMKRKPEQTPGAPPRKYMKNYCGRGLPVTTTSSDARERMAAQTQAMLEKLRRAPLKL